MKYLPLLIFLLALPLRAQLLDLDDDGAFEAWRASVEGEATSEETPVDVRAMAEHLTTGGTCFFEVQRPDGSTNYSALYKNCVCECLANHQDPREILECSRRCVVPGTFQEGIYEPADKAVEDLYRAGDFKTFYDYSLRGNGGSFGVAYELTDGMARTPWGPRYRYRDTDDETGQCAVGWEKLDNGRCRRGRRTNLTSEAAVSENAVGFHLGLKFIPIFDAGLFVGGKWNFKADEVDVTAGVQWIKLDF